MAWAAEEIHRLAVFTVRGWRSSLYDPEDLVQEAFLHGAKVAAIAPEASAEYLVVSMARRVMKLVQRDRARQAAALEIDLPTDGEMAAAEIRIDVAIAVRPLGAAAKSHLLLRAQGFTFDEVKAALGNEFESSRHEIRSQKRALCGSLQGKAK
jgi:DNA-directed RNA polymerase specialized sigma24 family protein